MVLLRHSYAIGLIWAAAYGTKSIRRRHPRSERSLTV